jgi:hypothetical protein
MNVEKENTFRALSAKPLLATHQWWCRIGIHGWLPWRDPVKNRRGIFDYIEQYRVCGHCGRAQRRLLARD